MRSTLREKRFFAAAAQIGDIISNTANYQSGIRAIGLRVAEQASIPMIASSALALLILGTESAVAVLNTGFGYTLRAAAPIAMLNFLRIASQEGIRRHASVAR